MTDQDATFVYNNRVRIYDLATGELIANQKVRNARDLEYGGEDLIGEFMGNAVLRRDRGQGAQGTSER